MSEYEYEKVEDMTPGQVVDAALKGEQFYNNGNGQEQRFNFERIDIFLLSNWLAKGCVFTRKEKPWWEGCEGSVVMVRDDDEAEWVPRILERIIDNKREEFPVVAGNSEWSQARPLTAAERDAIKVRG